MTPLYVVFQSWKKLHVLEKNIFRSKHPSNLFVQIGSSKQCADIFMKEMGLKIFNFWWFYGSEKLFFSIKLLIKLSWQKNKKIRHTGLETIISQIISSNSCKIALIPEELELLEYALWLSLFLTKIVSEGLPTSFNFSRGSC